jgi:hypothetical protein
MSETQPSQSAVRPEEKPTVEMAPPPAWAIDLAKRVNEGFSLVDNRLAKVEAELKADIQLVANDLSVVKDRVRLAERRLDDADERAKSNSIRVKSESEANLKQDGAISELVTKVDGLEKTQAAQLAILERLDKVAANPVVRRTAYAIATALLGYLAAKGYLR